MCSCNHLSNIGANKIRKRRSISPRAPADIDSIGPYLWAPKLESGPRWRWWWWRLEAAISEPETMDPRAENRTEARQFVQFFLFRLFSVFALSPGCVFGFMPAISPHTAHNHSHIICKDFCIYCQRFQGFPSPNRDPTPIPIPIRIWLQ